MKSVGLFLLGCLDIAVGIALIFKCSINFLAILSIGKGIWTMLTSFGYFWFFLLGILDTIGGILLLFLHQISFPSLINIIGFALLAKGIYSVIFSI